MNEELSIKDEFRVEQIGFEKPVSSYDSCVWGFAPVAPYHIGYDFFLHSLRQLDNAGVDVSVLLPSTYLEFSLGTSNIQQRIDYYGQIIGEYSNLDAEILSGEYQSNPEYVSLVLHSMGRASANRLRRALPDKNEYSPQEMILLMTQIVDPVYLGRDNDLFVVAGTGQRRVYSLSRDVLDEEKYPIYFTRLARDINGEKLSKSSRETRINLYDTYSEIQQKLTRVRQKDRNLFSDIYVASVEPFTSETIEPTVDEMASVIHDRFRRVRRNLDTLGVRDWVDVPKTRVSSPSK